MKYSTTLIGGKLVRRYRRFLVDVKLDNGTLVTAHCPNSGSMVGCSDPGSHVLLSESKDPHRRNAYTWEMIRVGTGLVGINVQVPRKVVAESLQNDGITELSGFSDLLLDAEYGRGNKVDIMMHGADSNLFMNVYHVAWAEGGVARFPESPNARARKGLKELSEVAAQGHKAVAFFFVQRSDCTAFAPAVEVDPEFAKLFKEAKANGVSILAYGACISHDEISLGSPLPCASD